MKISVIIPVYNAARFIGKAVASAVDQKFVDEVILVDDKSTDDSLKICAQLSREYDNVKLITHSDGQNHGAGASRNLGLRNAANDYIAFLDADDFYLPKRFEVPVWFFRQNAEIDGIYEAVGSHFYEDERQGESRKSRFKSITTVEEWIAPEKLFAGLVKTEKGSIHLDGLTVKKQLVDKCGCFSEKLPLHQDSNLVIQMAAWGKLVGGRLTEPVAMRGIHNANRYLNNPDVIASKLKARKLLFYWAIENNLPMDKLSALYYNYLIYLYLSAKRGGYLKMIASTGFHSLIKEILSHWSLSVRLWSEHQSRLNIKKQRKVEPLLPGGNHV